MTIGIVGDLIVTDNLEIRLQKFVEDSPDKIVFVAGNDGIGMLALRFATALECPTVNLGSIKVEFDYKAFYERNHRVMNMSDVLIICKSSSMLPSTGNILRYARKLKKKFEIVH